jgi:hypothetical protein
MYNVFYIFSNRCLLAASNRVYSSAYISIPSTLTTVSRLADYGKKIAIRCPSVKLLLAFARTIFLGSESRRTYGHILLSHDSGISATLSSQSQSQVTTDGQSTSQS